MLKSSVCDCSDAFILISGARAVAGAGVKRWNKSPRNNKQARFKNSAPFTDCKIKIINTQVDNAKGLDVVMSMHDLIKYINSYSKKSGDNSIWKYCKDEQNNSITKSEWFESKSKFFDDTNNAGTIYAKLVVALKQLGNFWRTLKMSSINCEINLILTCSSNFVISEGNRATTFALRNTKLYVPVLTLSG